MSKIRMSIMSLVVLALLLGQAAIANAETKVRVNATLTTPGSRVRISNTSSPYHKYYKARPLPIRVDVHYRITQRDQAIARRLAWYTGVPRGELIQFRRQGYDWLEIGRWLYLPRPVVRAAMDHRTWERFLREERMCARCGCDQHPNRQVIHVVDRDYRYDYEH